MTVYVPQSYVGWVQTAAAKIGIPYAVVAAQISEESGFNPGAVSPTGAEGIAQFEPGTWATWGHGSPFNTTDAWGAYTDFMVYLLSWSGGSIWKALAAYNAGQGNWQAGIGYANTVLALAGEGTGVKADTHQKVAAQYLPAPGGAGSGDDWSSHIRHGARWMFDSGHNHNNIGKVIGRM